HEEPVAHSNGQRSAGATLPCDNRDDRHAEYAHLEDVASDRLALPALFSAHARISALRVDQSDQRQTKTLREAHQTQRLSVALGFRHTVIAAYAFLRVATLLMSDDHGSPSLNPGQTAHDGQIVGIHSIAVQLVELARDGRDIVKRVRTMRMARELRDL